MLRLMLKLFLIILFYFKALLVRSGAEAKAIVTIAEARKKEAE
jgi:hypothetical protein